MQFTLHSPVHINVSKNKKIALNLNVYRNLHYQSSNKAKVNYKEAMREQIAALPVLKNIGIRYRLFVGSKRLCDVTNVCCIVDKFFMDALVEAGKLPDDNYEHCSFIIYEFGGYDKGNPRIEITIEEKQ